MQDNAIALRSLQ